MSRLTVTEKEHWKSRIERRIKRAIEAVEDKNPTLRTEIREKAAAMVHKSLGTAEFHGKIEELDQKVAKLTSEANRLRNAMYQHALGVDDGTGYGYQIENRFKSLLDQRQSKLEAELLKDSADGREILKLRSEQEALLDTVWLATSSKQIAELWSRVSLIVQDDLTPLQEAIIAERNESAGE